MKAATLATPLAAAAQETVDIITATGPGTTTRNTPMLHHPNRSNNISSSLNTHNKSHSSNKQHPNL